ncbi:transposase [Alkalitalea saponilacus]|uniref:IS21 family transposase n=1 Tax=Alkalitalea saponilacus TaxID=889453 RepID=UPI000B4C13B3|nr:IS21 family transposase [Alkalitalea saponilacus]ASB50182.1 transposase [Alkalitalea saponilacus]ASB50272.1 transposase [Alkalitalea saponilacus]
MAGKIIRMSQIKQLMHLHQAGKRIKEIARILQISRNTVKGYLDRLTHAEKSIAELLQMDDPILEAHLHVGNPAYKKSKEYIDLMERIPYLLRELKRTGVTRHLLWEEYKQENPNGYGYSQFCFHLQQMSIAKNPSMVLNHEPGEKLFIDFAGKKLSYIDKGTGEIIECQVFVACLPYSDFAFAMAVRSQSIEDFISALNCCLIALGGSPNVLVPDNFKAAITKACAYEPSLNQALEDFANHYEMTVIPARVRKPQDKALVENQVKLIYNRVYAKLRDRQFFSLSSLNDAIKEKVLSHNQTRMQNRNYCREERFLAKEKPLLGALPEQLFEVKYYKQLQVTKNNHIWLSDDKHFYSAPYRYIGQKVKVIYTRSTFKVYVNGKCIAVHPRETWGRYTTNPDHLCSSHKHYLDRSPDYYINKARSNHVILQELFQHIFAQNRHPEQLYRTCDGLLALYRKTEQESFIKACEIAINVEKYSYGFIKNIIQNRMTEIKSESGKSLQQPLPEHNNVRGKDYYN